MFAAVFFTHINDWSDHLTVVIANKYILPAQNPQKLRIFRIIDLQKFILHEYFYIMHAIGYLYIDGRFWSYVLNWWLLLETVRLRESYRESMFFKSETLWVGIFTSDISRFLVLFKSITFFSFKILCKIFQI